MSNDTFQLIRQFLRSPQSIGTLLPSSRELAEAMLEPVDFKNLKTIVEFGPGSGALTAIIAEKIPASARYVGIEINPLIHERLRGRFPKLEFVNQSAGEAESILTARGIREADAIICGLPWASLPSALQPNILNGAVRCLRPGGVFATYAFLQGLLLPGAWNLRRRLRHRFAQVETTRIIWNNVPPAFAYICRR